MFDAQPLHTGLKEYALLSTFRGHHFWGVELHELPLLEWRCISPPSFPPSLPLPTVVCTWLLPLRPQWLSRCPSSPSSHRVQTDYDGPVGHQHKVDSLAAHVLSLEDGPVLSQMTQWCA